MDINKVFKLPVDKRIEWTIDNYKIIEKGDKVIIAYSGGKDSSTILDVLSKLSGKKGFTVEALHIDLGIDEWRQAAKKVAESACKKVGVKLTIIDLKDKIGKYLSELKKPNQSLCHVCGIVKRWVLNKVALEMKGNVLATGHHADDQVHTFMMNIFRNNLLFGLGQLPKAGVESNKMFVQRIKPLFFCFEEEIKKYVEDNKLEINSVGCSNTNDVLRRNMRRNLNFTKEQKINVLMNSVKIIEKLRRKEKQGELVYCSKCGFPSRNLKCQFCEILDCK